MEKTKLAVKIADKRRFLRFSVHYLAYAYINQEIINANVLDISEGGIGIIVAKKLSFHDEIFLKVMVIMEEAHQSHIQFKAKVNWIEETRLNDMYVAGLEITEISCTDVLVLRRLLDELCEKECLQSKNEKIRYLKKRKL